jgi:hypothetical protein
VACGAWKRVCTPIVTHKLGLTGVFLDPPYKDECRSAVYSHETSCFDAVQAWAIANGDNPLMRIVLCGYDDFEMPSTWQWVAWKAVGGYSSANTHGNDNCKRERIWFSPHCLPGDA